MADGNGQATAADFKAPGGNATGRRSRLTSEVVEMATLAVRAGAGRYRNGGMALVAAYVGVSERCLWAWLEMGREEAEALEAEEERHEAEVRKAAMDEGWWEMEPGTLLLEIAGEKAYIPPKAATPEEQAAAINRQVTRTDAYVDEVTHEVRLRARPGADASPGMAPEVQGPQKPGLLARLPRDDQRATALQLYRAVKRAEAEGVVRALGLIQSHGREHWQAEAWFAERSYPRLFGRTMTHEILRGEPGEGPAPGPGKADNVVKFTVNVSKEEVALEGEADEWADKTEQAIEGRLPATTLPDE